MAGAGAAGNGVVAGLRRRLGWREWVRGPLTFSPKRGGFRRSGAGGASGMANPGAGWRCAAGFRHGVLAFRG